VPSAARSHRSCSTDAVKDLAHAMSQICKIRSGPRCTALSGLRCASFPRVLTRTSSHRVCIPLSSARCSRHCEWLVSAFGPKARRASVSSHCMLSTRRVLGSGVHRWAHRDRDATAIAMPPRSRCRHDESKLILPLAVSNDTRYHGPHSAGQHSSQNKIDVRVGC